MLREQVEIGSRDRVIVIIIMRRRRRKHRWNTNSKLRATAVQNINAEVQGIGITMKGKQGRIILQFGQA